MSKISALPRFSGPPYEPSSQSADRETLKFSLSMSLVLAVPSQKEPEYIAAKIGYKAAFRSMTAESADKPPCRGRWQNESFDGERMSKMRCMLESRIPLFCSRSPAFLIRRNLLMMVKKGLWVRTSLLPPRLCSKSTPKKRSFFL